MGKNGGPFFHKTLIKNDSSKKHEKSGGGGNTLQNNVFYAIKLTKTVKKAIFLQKREAQNGYFFK